VLPKLSHLALCRSIQLLTLLACRDAAKELEIRVLRHQLAVPRRQVPRPKFERTDPACLPSSAGRCRGLAGHASASDRRRCSASIGAWSLARGRSRVDASGSRMWASAARRGRAAAARPPGTGASWLGPPAHPSRAAAAWDAGLGNREPRTVPPAWLGPCAAADIDDVADVASPAGQRNPRLRPASRRQRPAATALGAVLHRPGHPTRPPGRGHCQTPTAPGLPSWCATCCSDAASSSAMVRTSLRDRDATCCRAVATCSVLRARRWSATGPGAQRQCLAERWGNDDSRTPSSGACSPISTTSGAQRFDQPSHLSPSAWWAWRS
jgi:hypothetical protein